MFFHKTVKITVLCIFQISRCCLFKGVLMDKKELYNRLLLIYSVSIPNNDVLYFPISRYSDSEGRFGRIKR